jgi:ABC-type multidrug transport system permease subunit
MNFASSTCRDIGASTTNCDYYYQGFTGASTTNGFTNGEVINSWLLFLIFMSAIFIIFTLKFFNIRTQQQNQKYKNENEL